MPFFTRALPAAALLLEDLRRAIVWIASYVVLLLVAALLGAFAASAVRSPAGAEMTLRDVRWPSLAVVGLLCSFSPPEGVATAEAVLIATGSAAVAGWAVFGRVAGERAARGRGGPGSCVTCVALLPAARSVPAGSPQGVRVSGPVGAETVPPQHRQHHDASTGSGS